MKFNHKGSNKITMPTNMRVEVELEAFKKMQCYIDICNEEVGWLGTAYKEGNVITVKDVFLFDQEVHATTCELTPQGLADFTMGLFETMPSDDAMEIVNNMALWGHSHVRMSVSPSGQDDKQLREFSDSGYTWFLRVIGNKLGNFEYTYMDYETGIEIKDLDWDVKIPGLDLTELKKEVQEEVKAKVKPKTVSYGRYGSYFSGQGSVFNSGYSNNKFGNSLGHGRSATQAAEQIALGGTGYGREDGWPDCLLNDPCLEDYDAPIDDPHYLVEAGMGEHHASLISAFPVDELDNDTYETLDYAMQLGLSIEDFANIYDLSSHCKTDRDSYSVVSYYLQEVNSDALDALTLTDLKSIIEICENLGIYLGKLSTIKAMPTVNNKGFTFVLKGNLIGANFKEDQPQPTDSDEKVVKSKGKSKEKTSNTGKKRGRPRKSEAEKAKSKKN